MIHLEFYILWHDNVWSVDGIDVLEGRCAAITIADGRQQLIEKHNEDSLFLTVGPLYNYLDLEETKKKDEEDVA